MTNAVSVRPARFEDISAVSAIFAAVLAAEGTGKTSTGWLPGIYPTRKTAEDAFAAGELFVLTENGVVAAAGRINGVQMPAYADVDWLYAAPEESVSVLHTLAVSPALSGRGLGKRFIRFYEEYSRESGRPYLRIDTNAKNVNARRLYASLGYREAGIIPCVFNGIPDVHLVCLEKFVG